MVKDKLDSKDLEVLRSEYQKLADDWRHINTIIWELPSVAVAIFTGILVAAYSIDSVVGLARIACLSIGSLFLFAVTIEIVKKRHDLNIIGLIQQKLLANNVHIKLPENLILPIGLDNDIGNFHKHNPDLKKFRDYQEPVFEFFYRSYAKQFLTYVILTAAVSMAILAELEFFWYVVNFIGNELAYGITTMIGIIAIIAPFIVYTKNLNDERFILLLSNIYWSQHRIISYFTDKSKQVQDHK